MISGMFVGLENDLNIKDSFCQEFHETVEKLSRNYDCYLLVNKLTASIERDKYRSMLDFMLINAFPELKELCLKYYTGKGPSLDNCGNISWKDYKDYDNFLSRIIIPYAMIAKMHPELNFKEAENLFLYIIDQEITKIANMIQ